MHSPIAAATVVATAERSTADRCGARFPADTVCKVVFIPAVYTTLQETGMRPHRATAQPHP